MDDRALDALRIGHALGEALNGRAEQRYDVEIVRWMDGQRIVHPPHRGLSGLEVLTLHLEERMHPGVLARFEVTAVPTPWPP